MGCIGPIHREKHEGVAEILDSSPGHAGGDLRAKFVKGQDANCKKLGGTGEEICLVSKNSRNY